MLPSNLHTSMNHDFNIHQDFLGITNITVNRYIKDTPTPFQGDCLQLMRGMTWKHSIMEGLHIQFGATTRWSFWWKGRERLYDMFYLAMGVPTPTSIRLQSIGRLICVQWSVVGGFMAACAVMRVFFQFVPNRLTSWLK